MQENKHEMSENCGTIIHVDGYTREGREVSAYDRRCGRNHINRQDTSEKLLNTQVPIFGENEDEIFEQVRDKAPSLTDKYNKLLTHYWPHLRDNEGFTDYAYLDSLGNITIGPGLNVNDKTTFLDLPWENKGRLATVDEKEKEFQRFQKLKENKLWGKNTLANYYKTRDSLTISKHFLIDTATKHLEHDLAQLENKFPEFESYPSPLQMVLLDMQYNMADNFDKKKWPNFYNGVQEKNVTKLIKHVNRYQVGTKRNDWARDMLREIPLMDGWHTTMN